MGWVDTVFAACPSWLQDKYGSLLMGIQSVQLDAAQEIFRQGIVSRMPGYGTPEALPYIGRDRLLPRGPNEPLDGYVGRLQGAFDTWRVAGNAATMLRQVSVVASPSNLPTTIRTVSAESTLGRSVWHKTTDGETVTKYVVTPGWDWDGQPELWSRLWVIIDATSAGISQWFIGDPGVAIGDGHTIGSDLTSDQVQTIRTIATSSPAKAAHVKLMNIIVDFSAGFSESNPGANPNGTWDNPSNRNPGAIYFDGDS